MKIYTLSSIVLSLSSAIFSQQEVDSLKIKEDNGQIIERRTFDEQLTEKYNGEEFNYNVNDGNAQNLIERFLQWFFQTLRDNFGVDISPEAIQVITYFIYLLMGGLVVYLLVRFFIGENISSIFKKAPSGLIDINLSEDHIELVDLEVLLNNAMRQKDFRLAIRYQYLKILKTLSQRNIIDWHFEKTNLDYLQEISTPAIQKPFKEVSYLYDYIWYGEQYVDEEIYTAAEDRFRALENQIFN